ncbi:hypothetical protein MPER_10868, partial [Moniliophthora perniciosa FA553]
MSVSLPLFGFFPAVALLITSFLVARDEYKTSAEPYPTSDVRTDQVTNSEIQLKNSQRSSPSSSLVFFSTSLSSGGPLRIYVDLKEDICCVEYDLRKESHVGETSLGWAKEYGPTYKIPGCFGETILVTSDPRAISHVLHEHVIDYPATRDTRKLYELVFGRGVLWAVGDEHKRHRRLSDKWNTEIQQGTQIIDVVTWCQKVTLDIIGESSFNYRFEALEDKPNELTEALHELEKLGLSPSVSETLLQALLRHLPTGLGRIQAKYFPMSIDKHSMKYLEVSSRKARELMRNSDIVAPYDVDQVIGRSKDVLSVLETQVRANRAEDPRKQLDDGEVTSQISTLLQAGHHTTGYSLAWILYELSRHPTDQQRIYEDIKQLRSRTQGNFTAKDYDDLANGWLGLCVKVLESAGGKMLSQVEVHAGQRVLVDVIEYNR